MTSEVLAEICHEANRVYCSSLGDDTQTLWGVAPEWQKESNMKDVLGMWIEDGD